MSERPTTTAPAADVDADLALVLERLVRVVRQLASAGGLSVPAASTLTRAEREGPQRLTDLAVSQGVSQPGMTQLVGRLERDGLVRRVPSPDDGRVALVEVTAEGRRLVATRRAERAAALGALLAELDPADRTAVHAAVPALARLAELALRPDAQPPPTSDAPPEAVPPAQSTRTSRSTSSKRSSQRTEENSG
ncbi:MAG: MarR family winged helix-turn-helix transcriptional regulator [Motilibacteraceae bacterium]